MCSYQNSKKQPKAIATHCHCHVLSLSVTNSSIKTGSDGSMDWWIYQKKIVWMIKYPSKREALLSTVKKSKDEHVLAGLAKFSTTH